MTNSSRILPTQSPAYLPAVDGLRALSILAVLAFHGVDFLRSILGKNGWLGVDIFFVISGFLISRLAMAEIDRHGSLNISRFFLGRVLRITPAIWVLLSVYALLNPLDSSRIFQAVSLAVLNFTDYDVALGWNNSIESGLGFCWSLAVEEKFYLLFPLLMIFYKRFRSPLCLLVLVVLAEAWKFSQIAPTTDALRLMGAFDIRFDEILIGCLAASLLDRKERYSNLFNTLARPIVPPLLFLCVIYFLRHFVYPPTLLTLAQKQLCWVVSIPIFALLVGLLLLSLAAVQEQGRRCLLSKALSCPPMIGLGRLSYSLYLWHGLAFLLAANLVLQECWLLDAAKVAAAIFMAFVSYSLVEKPFLTIKKHLCSATASSLPQVEPEERNSQGNSLNNAKELELSGVR
ncbi:MAG: acyltransferase [Candidatus Obscuribacterales bacterium]